jgi:hypothetical protein
MELLIFYGPVIIILALVYSILFKFICKWVGIKFAFVSCLLTAEISSFLIFFLLCFYQYAIRYQSWINTSFYYVIIFLPLLAPLGFMIWGILSSKKQPSGD